MKAHEIKNKEIESIKHKHIRYFSIFINDIYFRGMHAHNDIEFIYVLSGALGIATPDEQFNIQAGDVAYFNPTQPHSSWSITDTESRLLVIQADPSFCVNYYPAMRNLFVQSSNIASYADPDDLKLIRSYMIDAASAYFEETNESVFRCVGYINLIMSRLLDIAPYEMIPEEAYLSKANYEKRMLRIISYIQQHYTEKITLSSIAKSESLTTSYLSHFFTKHLHMSFQDLVNELRFERAVFLLKNSDMKIIDVCIESGFSDSKYLNRMFLSVFGVTPKEFRANHKKGRSENSPVAMKENEYIYSWEESVAILNKMK